jgi:hypothetical protein
MVYWFNFVHIAEDADLTNILGSMNQQQLMQLLGKWGLLSLYSELAFCEFYLELKDDSFCDL